MRWIRQPSNFLENENPIKKKLENWTIGEVHFYLHLYWANAFGQQNKEAKNFKTGFTPIAEKLSREGMKFLKQLSDARGSSQYWRFIIYRTRSYK